MNNAMYMPDFLDDYGLTGDELRVYLRIVRRNGNGKVGCFESGASMAQAFNLTRHRVTQIITDLIEYNVIIKEDRPGKSPILKPQPFDLWKPSHESQELRKKSEIAFKKKYEKKTTLVGSNEPTLVGANETTLVGANETTLVGTNETTLVGTNYLSIYHEGNTIKEDISYEISKKSGFTKDEKAERVFAYWKRRMSSKRSVFTKERKAKIKKVLEQLSYSDCLRAIAGCAASDWHMGRHPENQTLYNEFERIFKKTEETEKFIIRYFRQLHSRRLPKTEIVAGNNNKFMDKGEINAQRITNTNNIIAELFRRGDEDKQNISGKSNDNSQKNLLIS